MQTTSLIAPLVHQLMQAMSTPCIIPGEDATAAKRRTWGRPQRPLTQSEALRRHIILDLVRSARQIPLPLLIQRSAARLGVAPTTADKSIRAMRRDGVLDDAPITFEARQTYMITQGKTA